MQIKKWKTTCPLYTYATIHQRYTIPTNGSSIKKTPKNLQLNPLIYHQRYITTKPYKNNDKNKKNNGLPEHQNHHFLNSISI